MKLTLKQWRVIKGYSQEDLAKLIGVSTNTYGSWERDSENITIKNLKIIAEVLEITVEDLISK